MALSLSLLVLFLTTGVLLRAAVTLCAKFKRFTKHDHQQINFKVNGGGVTTGWCNVRDPHRAPTSVNKVRAQLGEPRLRTGCQRSSPTKLARFS